MKRPFPNKRFYGWYFFVLIVVLAITFPLHHCLGIELLFFGLLFACLVWFLRARLLPFVLLLLLLLLFHGYYSIVMNYTYPGTVYNVNCGKLQEVFISFSKYANDHNTYPTAYIKSGEGKPLLSWRVTILPYLGYEELYRQFHLDEAWDSPHNLRLLPRMPEVYKVSPYSAEFEPGYTAITTVVGPNSLLSKDKPVRLDDVSDHFGVLTLRRQGIPWTAPDDLNSDSTTADLLPNITVISPFPITRTLFNYGYSSNRSSLKVVCIGFADQTVQRADLDRLRETRLFPRLFSYQEFSKQEQTDLDYVLHQ